jgi:hypothetical protein
VFGLLDRETEGALDAGGFVHSTWLRRSRGFEFVLALWGMSLICFSLHAPQAWTECLCDDMLWL